MQFLDIEVLPLKVLVAPAGAGLSRSMAQGSSASVQPIAS
jgi:hypothetical protein